MRAVCRVILVLDVLYCLVALGQDGMPGWRMFEGVEDVRASLRDKDGRDVDVRAWLPRGANLTDRSELRRIVRFVCEKEIARAPFVYQEPATGFRAVLGDGADPRGCMIHASR